MCYDDWVGAREVKMFSYMGGMASGMMDWAPKYKSDCSCTTTKIDKSPAVSWDWGDISLSYRIGQKYLEFDDMSGNSPGKIKEEEVRRLHSFLSQWLETNQNDYF